MNLYKLLLLSTLTLCEEIQEVKTCSSETIYGDIVEHSIPNMEKINFGIKVLKYTQSSFERQILESVLTQGKRGHHLLNSRAEYNRCAILRLVSKMGEKEIKKWKENDSEALKKEEELETKIRNLKKQRNKKRAECQRRAPPATQRKKDDGDE